eukprot:1736830-Pyramimonas_sp.AAC.1
MSSALAWKTSAELIGVVNASRADARAITVVKRKGVRGAAWEGPKNTDNANVRASVATGCQNSTAATFGRFGAAAGS